MKVFSAIVKYSKVLQEVDFSRNPLKDGGVAEISRTMRRNRGLQVLKLSSVGLTDASALNLNYSLSYNLFLRVLDISNNRFSTSGIGKILPALDKGINDSLVCLNIENNDLEWNIYSMINNT